MLDGNARGLATLAAHARPTATGARVIAALADLVSLAAHLRATGAGIDGELWLATARHLAGPRDGALAAAREAISSPLLEGASVNGARGVIINVTGGPDLSLVEVSEASSIVQEAADEDANIIFGAVLEEPMQDEVKITVIATGFDRKPETAQAPAVAAAAAGDGVRRVLPQHAAQRRLVYGPLCRRGEI